MITIEELPRSEMTEQFIKFNQYLDELSKRAKSVNQSKQDWVADNREESVRLWKEINSD